MKINLKESNIQISGGQKADTKKKHFFKKWMPLIIFLLFVVLLIQNAVLYFYMKNLDDQVKLANWNMDRQSERIQRFEKFKKSDGKLILNLKFEIHSINLKYCSFLQ